MKSTEGSIEEEAKGAAGVTAWAPRSPVAVAFGLALALVVAGCSHCPLCGGPWQRGDGDVCFVAAPPMDMRTVDGAVTCLERMAILPTFEVKVSLARLDTTSGKPEVVAEQTVGGFNSFPVPFSLEYDHSKLIEGATYGLMAELVSQGARLFCTDTQYKVISNGNGGPVELVIVRAPDKK